MLFFPFKGTVWGRKKMKRLKHKGIKGFFLNSFCESSPKELGRHDRVQEKGEKWEEVSKPTFFRF